MRSRVRDPRAFGKVAVLMGGWSSEREVSLWSGQGVTQALRAQGVDAYAVDATPERLFGLRLEGFDRAFNVLHGTGGEDGHVQAILDLIGVPYTGSGVLASALAMDKLRSKRIWKAEGLPTPDWRLLASPEDAEVAGDALGYPYFVKPSEEGSSVGISKVRSRSESVAAYLLARGAGPVAARQVLAEAFVGGGEYTCAMLDGETLPIVRIEPDGDFYDYHAKYVSDKTRYHCPSGLSAAEVSEFGAIAARAFDLIGASGWGRVDFLLDPQRRPWLLEANLVPGMTTHSLVPMAAAARGMGYETLCWAILETTLGAQAPVPLAGGSQ